MSNEASTKIATEFGLRFPNGNITWSGTPRLEPDKVPQSVKFNGNDYLTVDEGGDAFYRTNHRMFSDIEVAWRASAAKNGLLIGDDMHIERVSRLIITITTEPVPA